MNDLSFAAQGNCVGTDTEAFFSENGVNYTQINLIKKICDACTVQQQCLEYALHNAVNGYWGGTVEQQRRKIRRARNIIPNPVMI